MSVTTTGCLPRQQWDIWAHPQQLLILLLRHGGPTEEPVPSGFPSMLERDGLKDQQALTLPFASEKTETQRGKVTCLRQQSLVVQSDTRTQIPWVLLLETHGSLAAFSWLVS